MTRLVPFLFLLVAVPVAAQSAAEYYHAAAQHYIAEANAEAERAAVAGLALAPDDQKLQALLDKIREKKEQQSGQQEERDDADEQAEGEGDQQQDRDESGAPQPSDEGEQNDPAQQQNEQQRDNQQPEGLQPEEPSDAQPEDEREGDAGSAGEPDDGSPQSGDGTASPYDVKPGTMSRAEAERILRAIEADELELLRDVQRRRTRPRYVEKDW